MLKILKICLVVLALVQTGAAATLTPGYTIGSGLLGNSLIMDNAATGGGDSSSATGNPGWTAELAGLWTSNSTVSISGIALPIYTDANTSSTTVSGTFTFYFYDLDAGTNANAFNGTGVETLLGTNTATFTQGSAPSAYYAVFDSPINFTAKSSGVAVRIINTGWIRLKINTASSAPGVVLKNSTTGVAVGGANPNFRMSLAGTVFSPSLLPPRVNLAKYQAASSSTVSSQYAPDFMNDGLVNNHSWRSANVSSAHWAEVDFPMAVTIASAHVYSGIDDGSVLASFKVQYKSGANWVEVPGSSRSGNTSPATNIIFTSPVTSDSFRLHSDANNTQCVKEFALFPPNPGPGGVEQGYLIGTDVELNLAKKRPAFATAISGTNYPKLAVDGFADSASKWQTTLVGSNSLMVDLRIPAKIGSAHLYSGDGAVPPITNFVLQYWTGSAWANISGASITGNTNAERIITFTTPVTTTNIQLVFTNASVSAVRELCIFPANGGVGYPLGQDVVAAPPPTMKWEDFNDAFYNVINRAANLSATISAGAPSLGNTNLADPLNQYQVLLNIGTDTYRLRNRVTGQCLAGAGLSTNPGALLVDEDYTALPHQNWRLLPVDGTDFLLVNQWSGLLADTQSGGTNAGTALVQNTNSLANSQRWRFSFQAHYPKKGLAGNVAITNWSQFKGNWAYNWGRETGVNLPVEVAFNPMQWGNFNWDIGSAQGPVEQFTAEWRRADKPLYLLGFNEPDGAEQSNISTNQAIQLWPRLERMELPLASPVTVNPLNAWMQNFMTEAEERGYRMDIVAAHKYPSPAGGDPSSLISELQAVNTTWGRPVWLTEFSTVDWVGNATWTQEDNYNWLAEFMWRAESLEWLRRYSLFLFTANTTNYAEPANPWDPVGPRSNAFDTNGTPTSFGELYFAWDCDAAVRGDKAYFIHNKGERKRLRNANGSSAPGHGSIREGTNTTQWVLRAAPVSGQWYVTSLRDGRRLRYTGGSTGVVDFVAANTIGPTVTWTLTEDTNGWFYLENPAAPSSNRRLKDIGGAFSMVSTANTGDQIKWRFIPPYAPAATAPPGAPVNLMATGGTNQISLTWNSGGGTSNTYSIYRGTNSGGSYSLIASNQAALAYLDTNVIAGKIYFYVSAARDLFGGDSLYSNEATAAPAFSLPTTPTNIACAVSNNTLTLSWPASHTGWLLQAQTNSSTTGLGTNWVTIAGSDSTNTFTTSLNLATPAVFYRLALPW